MPLNTLLQKLKDRWRKVSLTCYKCSAWQGQFRGIAIHCGRVNCHINEILQLFNAPRWHGDKVRVWNIWIIAIHNETWKEPLAASLICCILQMHLVMRPIWLLYATQQLSSSIHVGLGGALTCRVTGSNMCCTLACLIRESGHDCCSMVSTHRRAKTESTQPAVPVWL